MDELHLGLDLLFLTGRSGGTETYTRQLLAALGGVEPSLRVTGFVNSETAAAPPSWLSAIDLVPVRARGTSRLSWGAAEAILLPVVADRRKVDLLHCPANFAPLTGRVPRIVTVHDLLHRHYPELVAPGLRQGVRLLVDGGAKRATRILADSHATADDIERYLGIGADRVDVVPLGAGTHRTHPVGNPLTALGLRERQFVLSVGNPRPHKNLERLVEAVATISRGRRPMLVLTGDGLETRLGPMIDRLGVSEDVRLVGWVDEGTLEGLYASCSAYIHPSLFEGFGLPVLEAMQRGTPVACSAIPVLREVAGEAALYFDPMSPSSIGAAISQLCESATRRRELSQLGLDRAATFTWERTAELTLAAYERTLADAASGRQASR